MTTSAGVSISNNRAFANPWLLAVAAALITSLLIVAPFFWLGSASGHDFEFHIASWLDAASQWREGTLFPRWTEWANHGFGEPRFIFYPPLSWLLGAGLSLALPANLIPIAFIVLAQTFAGLSAFAFLRRVLPDRSALFGAVCYTASPNALLVIYMRSDYAELLASAFFPLLFLAALQVGGFFDESSHSARKSIALFSVAFAAIWLSNAPAGVMVTYSSALLFAWAALAQKSWLNAALGFAAMALGFGLAAFYMIPAVYEQPWVNITQALSTGLRPAENFLYTQINDPEHNFFNWIASSLAILLMIVTGIAALLTARYRSSHDAESRAKQPQIWNALLLIAAAATFLTLKPSSLFWQLLPKLRFVQFPWRWMSILTIPFVYFLAAAFIKRRYRWTWITAMTVILVSTATFLVKTTWWDADDVSTLQTAIASGDGFDGTDEYDPLGVVVLVLPSHVAQVQVETSTNSGTSLATPQISIVKWTAQEKQLQVTSAAPLKLKLRLLNYPAWRVTINGHTVTPERTAETGQMVLPVAAGSSTISVQFASTADRVAGGILSIVSSCVLLLFIAAMPTRRSSEAANTSARFSADPR